MAVLVFSVAPGSGLEKPQEVSQSSVSVHSLWKETSALKAVPPDGAIYEQPGTSSD